MYILYIYIVIIITIVIIFIIIIVVGIIILILKSYIVDAVLSLCHFIGISRDREIKR
jgi:hypothetical protein